MATPNDNTISKLLLLLANNKVFNVFQIVEKDNLTLLKYGNYLYAVSEDTNEHAFTLTDGQPVMIVSPVFVFAMCLTDGLYTGFHDKMAFAIRNERFLIDGFLGLGIFGQRVPNYAAIRSALEHVGLSPNLEWMR